LAGVEVHRLHVSTTHPDPALPWADGDAEVYAYLIADPEGLVLVDTGAGQDNEVINTLYRPEHHDLGEAIAATGHGLGEVSIIVNSHLHFDHCGNNRLFPGVPILVQRREYEAAHEPFYTSPDWVDFPGANIKQLDGDCAITRAVRVVSTPGHSPGHQSVVVGAQPRIVIAAQAAYTPGDFSTHQVGERNTPTEDEETWRRSIQVLHDLQPDLAYFSHDSTDWRLSAPR
jgi:N-acyl homoserine lactone hydrolase